MFKKGAFNRKLVLQECLRNNFSPNILISTDQIEAIKKMVARNIGLSFLIESIVQDSSTIVAKPLQEPLHLDFGFAWAKDRYLSIAAKTFIDFVAKSKLSF